MADKILSLSTNVVDIWSTSLNVPDEAYDVLNQSLSPDEWERAYSFVFEKDQRHYIIARGILRAILAMYLGCLSTEIKFLYENYGKPRLGEMEPSIRLEFNLSHSFGFLVLAVSWGRQIGIDVERVRPVDDLDHLAAITFSEYEQNELSTFTPDKKLLGFFNCWTRKEAYVKAIGSGLLAPLDTFDMSLAPDNPICMLSNRLDPKEVTRWSFYTFVPEPGFVSALAVEGQDVIIQLKRWRVDR